MASSSSEWTVTMDEDGQHDPADIAALLDSALSHHAALVYADPINPAPHSAFRRVTSKGSKREARIAGKRDALAVTSRLRQMTPA